MTVPRVFILIPAYNVGDFLTEAVESVLAQTSQDWTMLILDDCSTDHTGSIAASFAEKDKRITFIRNEQNLGMVENWNKGIAHCNSPYFIKLDGDDKWHPEMIQSALGILNEREDVGIVFTNYVKINHDGKVLDSNEIDLPDFARDKSFSCIPLVKEGASKMLSYPVLRQGLSVMRSKVFAEVGTYRLLITPETQASSDTEFYFRIGSRYQIYCIDRVLYFYRVHPNSISAINYAKGLSAQKIYEVKNAINNYYYEQKKIDASLWYANRVETDFNYELFLNYQSRIQGNFFDFLKISLRMIIHYPIKTLSHFLGRLTQK